MKRGEERGDSQRLNSSTMAMKVIIFDIGTTKTNLVTIALYSPAVECFPFKALDKVLFQEAFSEN